MKKSNVLTALTSNEIKSLNGGTLTSSEGGNTQSNGLPIVPFGDPSDWDFFNDDLIVDFTETIAQ